MGEIIELIVLIFFAVLCLLALVFYSWTLYGLIRSGVPYVPTTQKMAKRMVQIANIKKGQKVYDLGCGNGKILFEAEKKGVICTGYELICSVVWYVKLKKKIKKSSIKIFCKDFFSEDISDADIIFCYLFPSVMDRIYKEKWNTLKKGTKLISNTFPLTDVKPTQQEETKDGKIFIYEK